MQKRVIPPESLPQTLGLPSTAPHLTQYPWAIALYVQTFLPRDQAWRQTAASES